MKVIDIVRMDCHGRVTLDGIGIEKWAGVRAVVDLEKEMIELIDGEKFSYGKLIYPDQGVRITIPKWARNEIGDGKDFLLLVDEESGKIFLSPKTGKVL